ncbi:unnamed protein product [Fraxinus pennsylvanica]|uniref:DUF7769 domain-containing protein n=1 Tax=Fraxinus pennsylvanica TaxID=56036 RepID=A0AAD2DVT9_9LAMI|nr:unnamed protein product [Fraxinus pennsylvanica]
MKDLDLNQLAAEQEMNGPDLNSLYPDCNSQDIIDELHYTQPEIADFFNLNESVDTILCSNSDLNQPTSPRVVHISDGLDGPTSNSSVINLNESVSAGFCHSLEEIRSTSEDYLPDLEQMFDDDIYLNLDMQQNPPEIFEINLNEPETERDATDNTLLENIRPGSKKKNLTLEIKRAIVAALLEQSSNGQLLKGAVSNVANSFSISTRSVSRIWREAKDLRNTNGENLLEFRSKLTNRVGRKRIQVDIEQNHRLHHPVESLSLVTGCPFFQMLDPGLMIDKFIAIYLVLLRSGSVPASDFYKDKSTCSSPNLEVFVEQRSSDLNWSLVIQV